MIDIRIIQIKTNAQNLYGWIALSSTDHPIGHIFMHVELDNKIKFMDAWVHDDFKGYTAYAWCLPMSIGLLRKKGFTEGETCIYVEKKVE